MTDLDRLRDLLRAAVRHGSFTLASGRQSDLYVDGRLVTLDPEGATLAARLMLERALAHGVTAAGGLSVGADPLVSTLGAVAWQAGRRLGLFYVRKEQKAHGTCRLVEGPPLSPSDRVAILEDVVTTGASALKACEAVRAQYGCAVPVVLAMVDREEGGAEAIRAAGYAFEAMLTRRDLLV